MKKIILVQIAILGWICSLAQHAVFIHGGRAIQFHVHKGYLRYASGRVVSGFFAYADMEFPTYSVKWVDSATKKTKARIYMKDVNRMVLVGHDSTLSKNDSTYFTKFARREKLFRQLTFGDIQLFDNLFSVDENPGRIGNEFIIRQGATIKYIGNLKELGMEVDKLVPAAHLRQAGPMKMVQWLTIHD